MTIREVIEALTNVPGDRQNEELKIYICGPISGFLQIDEVEIDPDKDYIRVTSDAQYRPSSRRSEK